MTTLKSPTTDMNFRTIFLFLCVMIVSTSCRQSSSNHSSSDTIVNVDSLSDTAFKYSSLFQSIEFIAPTTDVLLKGIRKLQTYQDAIYLLDNRTVHAFRRDGQYIRRYGNIGAGPGEYANCNDFAVNLSDKEMYLLDNFQAKILRYDLDSGSFKGEIPLDARLAASHIACVGNALYAVQNQYLENDSEGYHLLYRIDPATGKTLSRMIDADTYNKGWKDEFLHTPLFYPLGDGKTAFVMGLMNVVMLLDGQDAVPFLTIQSKDFVTDADILEEEKKMTDTFGRSMHMATTVLPRFMKKHKLYQLSELFSHQGRLFLKCNGYATRLIEYDFREKTVRTYTQLTDDVLFQNEPKSRTLPTFLGADDGGVYFYLRNEQLGEFRHFVANGYVSPQTDTKNIIEAIDEDANPLILYYRYRD